MSSEQAKKAYPEEFVPEGVIRASRDAVQSAFDAGFNAGLREAADWLEASGQTGWANQFTRMADEREETSA